MRIDVITIFPEYLAPLELSLIGKARKDGLIDVHLHNLRDYTHDRHRTVDDTPVGGGAGMVMKPEPWSEAFADVLASGKGEFDDGSASPLVIFPNTSPRSSFPSSARPARTGS
ncbi:MAG: tRNA (guanosine(37)-N1)-methyltransferase TrmD, partial [Dermabacter sp.]|nr:tRNA (guanosine(37)-N1)-methyltransferase TrmD [Dermabacter sp.]